MFRRRPKATSEPDASTSRRAEPRSRRRAKAAPPGPLSNPEPLTDASDETAGDDSSEPWYRQSGPLFDESFRDSRPASPPPRDETSVFAPPQPADPAAGGLPPSVPLIQRVGQVTDPGPLGEEMRSAFEPEPAATPDDAAAPSSGGAFEPEPAATPDDAATDDAATDDAAASGPANSAAAGTAQPQDESSPWAPPVADAPYPEPGFEVSDAAAVEGDGWLADAPDPLIDFDAHHDAASEGEAEDESVDADACGSAGHDIAKTHDDAGGDAERGDSETGEDAPAALPGDAALGDTTTDDLVPERDGESTPAASALAASTAAGEVAQHEPPMVVPVRGYYIARTEDTLRSVAAQFLNAPERWPELRALNAAYPGIADLDPDDLVPEGAALALPGDPLPWGRPDPVYLWTLAETFLFTAWGREPAPEEVVPFWRGLTQGALPEGEQPTLGAELPGIAEAAARSDRPADETPEGPAAPPAAFEMPAVADADTTSEADADAASEDAAGTADAETEAASEAPGAAETDTPPGTTDAIGQPAPDATAQEAEPESEPAFKAADASEDTVADTPEDVAEAFAADDGAAPADEDSTVAEDAAESPPVVDTAELAGLVQAVEQAIEEDAQAAAEEDVGVTDGTEGGTVDVTAAEVLDVAPDMPPTAAVADMTIVEDAAAEPESVQPPPVHEEWATEPESVEPPPVHEEWATEPESVEPTPVHEEWATEPPTTPHPDPSAPYAGMPGAGTAEAPSRPPEAEAPRAPQFMPSVTSTTPSGLAPVTQTSPVGRSLAGTAVGDAMLLWQLARRRRQGQRAGGAPDAIEQSLLLTAGSESLELIEAAMRHLRAVTVDQQRPMPSVLAVRSGTYGFEVLLERPIPTPPGWRSASGGYVLELPQGVTARDLGAVGQGRSLCPALVPVGNTFEGPLLLNLEQLGCLAVSGPSAAAVGLLGAIVGALGSSPMAGQMRITAVGLESAASVIGWEAVSFANYDSPELEHLFANAYGPDDGMIDLLVIGPGNDLLIQRAGQAATAPNSKLSLVGATSAVSARWPWRIHVDGTGTAVVHPISVTMTAARAVPSETLASPGGASSGGIDHAGFR
jgi:hypothetical protein